MKRFTDYINEAHKGKNEDEPCVIPTICELLSHKSPIAFEKIYNRKPSLIYGFDPDGAAETKWEQDCIRKNRKTINDNEAYAEALHSWFSSEQGAKGDFMNRILAMGKCPNKGPWACWQGTAYRGLGKRKEWVQKLNFTGEVTTKKGNGINEQWLVAQGEYKSLYPAQSWTSDWYTAFQFLTSNEHLGYSGSDMKLGVIVEMKLTRDNTLFSPDLTNDMVLKYRESEVIRIGNEPTMCWMYIRAKELHNTLNMKIQYPEKLRTGGSEKQQEEYYINEWHKKLAVFIGEKNAKKLMSSAQYLKIVKNFRKTDY